MIIDEIFQENTPDLPEKALSTLLKDPSRVEYLMQLAMQYQNISEPESSLGSLYLRTLKTYFESVVEIEKLFSSALQSSQVATLLL